MSEWELHRQPKDQIADHEFSIWCDGEPVVLANVMPGEEGVLATIVEALNAPAASPPSPEPANVETEPLYTAVTRADAKQPFDKSAEPVWTEDSLALAFFDYSACVHDRCDFSTTNPCECATAAFKAVHWVKHVLPRSMPLAVTRADGGGAA